MTILLDYMFGFSAILVFVLWGFHAIFWRILNTRLANDETTKNDFQNGMWAGDIFNKHLTHANYLLELKTLRYLKIFVKLGPLRYVQVAITALIFGLMLAAHKYNW